MTRYFYTDPLAAAWMAKHFGMRFVTLGFQGKKYLTSDNYNIENFFPSVHGSTSESSDVFYVYADSMYLLEAKAGDWVAGEKIPGYLIKYEIDSLASKAALYVFYSGHEDEVLYQGEKIIQRDGKTFVWPERERFFATK